MKTLQLVIRIDDAVDRKLDEMARQLGTTKSEIVRKLITDAKVEARQRIVKETNGPALRLADFRRK